MGGELLAGDTDEWLTAPAARTCITPVAAGSLGDATVVGGGYVHSLAARGDGTLRAWGRNAEGELGDGTTTARSSPVTVSGLSGVEAAPPVNAAYTYDGLGLRATRTAGSASQHFAWDQSQHVPLLLTDGNVNYLYDDTGLPVAQIDANGNAL